MTVVNQAVSAEPFSATMREGSRAEHTAAENSDYMSQLLDGHVNQRGYTALLLRLRTVYAALETTGRELAGDPCVDAVLDPSLERLDAIESDLDYWAPDPDVRRIDSPAARAYRDRIRASKQWAPLFVAHHYTRYLGDLSGGQVLGRLLGRTFDLKGEGVSFYSFAEIAKPKPYKDAYRAALDRIGAELDPAGRERVLAEVKVAFQLNQAIFEELGAQLDDFRR